jgi:long-chain acyl-CoA synthetase
MYNKIVIGLKSAPRIKRLLFNWALFVGRQYFELKLKNIKIPMVLKIKHKIANKLIYSKIKARLGGKIKFFVSGGAPLSKEIAEFFASVDITILEGYGLTETSPVLTVNSPIAGIRYGTVGKPLFNVKIKIANDGEILAKGPNIMESYFNNNNATLEVFDNEGWFMTGDIGFIDEDNFLTITDRKKSLIVTSGGKNIAPSPLEGALLNSTYIDQVIVIGDKRNFISALIVPNFEMIINFLSSKKISLSEPYAIIEHEEVINIFNDEVIRLMEKFSNYEKVKKFTLLAEPLSIDKGEMTPKMSIVRKVVEKNYSTIINNMYEEL